uniref:Secreted protein n=1 Tax=Haemonchus placei TaxID=6290 RepID=A0A0N4X1A1_HAEPC
LISLSFNSTSRSSSFSSFSISLEFCSDFSLAASPSFDSSVAHFSINSSDFWRYSVACASASAWATLLSRSSAFRRLNSAVVASIFVFAALFSLAKRSSSSTISSFRLRASLCAVVNSASNRALASSYSFSMTFFSSHKEECCSSRTVRAFVASRFDSASAKSLLLTSLIVLFRVTVSALR